MNCGTLKGLQGHKSRNERPCSFCLPFMDELLGKAPPRRPKPIERQKPGPKPKPKRAKPKPARVSNRASPKPAVCGTTSGYKKHRRNGEEACDPCKVGHAADARARHAAKKEANQ